jgi:predicted transposase/invertase (TIGR01784 family)
MLTSMAILSGLVSAELPARLIARRKDIMIESAAYDIIKKEGYSEGKAEGKAEGRTEGRKEANQDSARNLLLLGILTDEQIAQATGLKLEEILSLKKETKK